MRDFSTKLLLVLLIASNALLQKTWGTPAAELEITFLDVGQGDAILVRSPDQLYGVIDTGPDASVLRQLRRQLPTNLDHLDFVLLTHADSDHIGGAVSVLKQYHVRELIVQRQHKNTSTWEDLKQLAKTQGVTTTNAQAGNKVQWGCCVFVTVLWPLSTYQSTAAPEDINDLSTAILLSFADFDIYLAGDLSSRWEIVAWQTAQQQGYFPKSAKQLEVLKTSHHGSKTSTNAEFLDLTSPQTAIISAGKQNKYGHPHLEVLNHLYLHNVTVWRTDQHGNIKIQVKSDSSYRIESQNLIQSLQFNLLLNNLLHVQKYLSLRAYTSVAQA
jgi:competence protein ComEC